jgi:hypothetical protein
MQPERSIMVFILLTKMPTVKLIMIIKILDITVGSFYHFPSCLKPFAYLEYKGFVSIISRIGNNISTKVQSTDVA